MNAVTQGLCAACRHRREIRSDRGSLFVLCLRSRTEPFYERYPRLPVWSCPGFDPVPEEAAPDVRSPGGDR